MEDSQQEPSSPRFELLDAVSEEPLIKWIRKETKPLGWLHSHEFKWLVSAKKMPGPWVIYEDVEEDLLLRDLNLVGPFCPNERVPSQLLAAKSWFLKLYAKCPECGFKKRLQASIEWYQGEALFALRHDLHVRIRLDAHFKSNLFDLLLDRRPADSGIRSPARD